MGDVGQLIENVRSAKMILFNAEQTEKGAVAQTIEARRLVAEAVKAFDAVVDECHKEWAPPYPKGNA